MIGTQDIESAIRSIETVTADPERKVLTPIAWFEKEDFNEPEVMTMLNDITMQFAVRGASMGAGGGGLMLSTMLFGFMLGYEVRKATALEQTLDRIEADAAQQEGGAE